MNRWFRFYDDAINDPKLLKLSDKTYRVWVGMLCLASKNGGKLPNFDDMVLMLRMKTEKLQPELERLIEAGLLDHDDAGIEPHNWKGRQYKSDVTDPTNAERQKRFRNAHRNGSNAVTDKRPDTEQIQNTEKQDAVAARPALEIVQNEDPDKRYFRRFKEVCGESSGGLGSKLLNVAGGVHSVAMSHVERASGKENPREYIGRIIASGQSPPATADGRSW